MTSLSRWRCAAQEQWCSLKFHGVNGAGLGCEILTNVHAVVALFVGKQEKQRHAKTGMKQLDAMVIYCMSQSYSGKQSCLLKTAVLSKSQLKLLEECKCNTPLVHQNRH